MSKNVDVRLMRDVIADYITNCTCTTTDLVDMTSMSRPNLAYFENKGVLTCVTNGKRYDFGEVTRFMIERNLIHLRGKEYHRIQKYDEPVSDILNACSRLAPDVAYTRLEMYALSLEQKIRSLETELNKLKQRSSANG